jgi:hypothetical protein
LPSFQILPKLRQEPLLRGEDRLWPKPVDPRRPFPPVALDPRPRHDEDGRVTYEVEQVVEPAIRIIDRPLMQLIWIRSTCDSASSRSGHSTSVFTGDLPPSSLLIANSLPPFAKWPAFPASDYYDGSVTSLAAEPTTRRPAGDLAGHPTGPAKDASHVHRAPVDGVGGQLCPCGIAPSTPQTFLVASLPATSPGPGVARPRRACTALRPISARLEPVYLLRGFTRWFLTSTFPSR